MNKLSALVAAAARWFLFKRLFGLESFERETPSQLHKTQNNFGINQRLMHSDKRGLWQ